MLMAMMTLDGVAHEYGVKPGVLVMLASRHGYLPGDVLVELSPGGGSVRTPLYTLAAVAAILAHGARSGDLPATMPEAFTLATGRGAPVETVAK